MHRWSGHPYPGNWPAARDNYVEQRRPPYEHQDQRQQSGYSRAWPDTQYGTHHAPQQATQPYGGQPTYGHGASGWQDYRHETGRAQGAYSQQPAYSYQHDGHANAGNYSGQHYDSRPYESRSQHYSSYPNGRQHGHYATPQYDYRQYEPHAPAPARGHSMAPHSGTARGHSRGAHGGGYGEREQAYAPPRGRVGGALPPHPSMQQHGARHESVGVPHGGAPSRPYAARPEGAAHGGRGHGAPARQQSIPYTGHGRESEPSKHHGGRSPRKQSRGDNKRARTAPGSKPSWWVPPDMSQGFASTEGKVKLDLLPAQQPALLQKPAAPAAQAPAAITAASEAQATAVEPAGARAGHGLEPATADSTEPPAVTTSAAAAGTPTEQPAAAAAAATADAVTVTADQPARTTTVVDGFTAPIAGTEEAQRDTQGLDAGPHDTTMDVEPTDTAADVVRAVDASVDLAPAETDKSNRDQLPILLFDLNGTLTSHTHQRQSSGITRVRPGVEALARLAHKCRMGIFSSASHRTVSTARALIEEATGGVPLFEPGLILHREHTTPAPQAAGRAWDTAKPLGKWFERLDRVLLLDDDDHKSLEDERSSLLRVPAWREEDMECNVMHELANALEEMLAQLTPDADIRVHVPAITERLNAVAGIRTDREDNQDNNETNDDLDEEDNDAGEQAEEAEEAAKGDEGAAAGEAAVLLEKVAVGEAGGDNGTEAMKPTDDAMVENIEPSVTMS